MANEVAKQSIDTRLSYYSNQFTGLMEKDFSEHGIEFDSYSKKCVMNAMSSMYSLVTSQGLDLGKLNNSNLRQVVGQVASLKLNASAVPRECYFQVRSKKVGNDWVKEIELGIEGDGNDAILRNFGVDVKKVHPVWIVKEGDEFVYPKRKGLELTPPEWEEKGISSKVVRVVYPVELTDGKVTYLIAERDSVKTNLLAHIRNNMMNETFGVLGKDSKGKDRTKYNANEDELSKIKEMKTAIMEEARGCKDVDEIIACDSLSPYISAAWLDTPESMIVRKMRNNAIKKFPKDFNSIASRSIVEMDETYQSVQEDIEENANSEDFIIDGEATDIDTPDFAR